MTKRDTKEIVTPASKSVLVINEYITGAEKRMIRNIFLRTDLTDLEKFNSAQDKTLELVVVSIDGSKSGDVRDGKAFSVVDAILDMRDSDTKFVIDIVQEITSEKKTTNVEKA